MEKEFARQFLKKKVKITTQRGWIYRGLFLEISNDGIMLDDIKCGPIYVALSDIVNMMEWRENHE